MAYAVTNAAGGEVTKVEKGDRVNIVLTIVDSKAPQDLEASQIAARVNNAAFTYTGLAKPSNMDTDAHTYTLLFRDVIYNGRDNNFNVDISLCWPSVCPGQREPRHGAVRYHHQGQQPYPFHSGAWQ